MKAAIHVLKYLKGEPVLGVLVNKHPTFDLLAYCDAIALLVPIPGSLLVVGNTLVSWKSKK